MKYLVAFSLIGLNVYADNCTTLSTTTEVREQREISTAVPKALDGAVIVVKLANGTEVVMKSSEYKVVPRKRQQLVTKVQNNLVLRCDTSTKNRLAILAGKGPQQGLQRSQSGSMVNVENQYGTILGLQYQRDLGIKVFGLPVNAGAQLQNNSTAVGLVGVDF